MSKITVLYPQPTDSEQFDKDYAEHLKLLHEKTGIPSSEKPYSVTKFLPGPNGPAPYYQMFSLSFESIDALKQALRSEGMQAVSADANRISSGGAPTVLIGTEI